MTNQTAQEIINRLSVPDAGLDSAAERQDTVCRHVESYPWKYVETRGLSAHLLVPSFLTLPRMLCDDVLADNRLVNAVIPDLPGAREINTHGLASRTVDRSVDFDGELMVPWEEEKPQQSHVPILVHRSGKTIVRHIIRGGYSFDDAMRRIDGHTLEDFRHVWADGTDPLKVIRALEDEHIPTQCDFGTHYGTKRQLFSWPIACGQFLVVLRSCHFCWTDFAQNNRIDVTNCRVFDPTDRIG